jgi:hypothetical protein
MFAVIATVAGASVGCIFQNVWDLFFLQMSEGMLS